MTDICCIGHITRDKIVTPGQTLFMSGGTSYYFAHAIARLPQAVSFRLVTKLAQEDRKAVADLQQAGIDVSVYDSRHTVFFENRYGANPDDRTQRVLSKADPFTIEELDDCHARIYHLGPLLKDDFSPTLIAALASRGRISIDAQGFLREVRGEDVHAVDWRDKLDILGMTDFLKVNEHEMEVVTGTSDPRQAALLLARWGVKEVLITLGSNGSMVYADHTFHTIPAYKPKAVVDATGCGDTYAAGYLYCRAAGKSIDYAGRFAAAMCTYKLEHSGPFDKTIADIERLLRDDDER